MPPKKSQGRGAKAGQGGARAANQPTAACKLHAAIGISGINLQSTSSIDQILLALNEDVADGNQSILNKPIPSLGCTALQHAIRSGAAQLVTSLLKADVFDIDQIDKDNLSSGRLSLLHEAAKSDSDDVLGAILEASHAKDIKHHALEVEIDGKSVGGVTPAVYLATMPVFLPELSTSADACNRRATMLARLFSSAETFGIDCGSHTLLVQEGSVEISALAVVTLLCHAFPMHTVLSTLAMKFAPDAAIEDMDAAAVSRAAKALEPVCTALIEKVTQAADDMVTSPPPSSPIPVTPAFWLSAPGALIAGGKIPAACGFDGPVHKQHSLMATHTTTPPKGLELPPMLPSQFCTFWAALDAEFAANSASLDVFKGTAGGFGLEALYLARSIPASCPLRQQWLSACIAPSSEGRTLGGILAATVNVPTPLKLNLMPAEFERVWFPGCSVEAVQDEQATEPDDVAKEYQCKIWQKFMLGRDVPVLSAILAEGMRGDGKVVKALLATVTEKDADEGTVRREVYDSCNSVPDAVGAALLQVASAEAGAVVPVEEWRIESLQSSVDDRGKSTAQNCTCVPILEFVNSVNRWESQDDARIALEALLCDAPALSQDALAGSPICNLMPWTTDLLPVPGTAAASPEGKPSVPGAGNLNSLATNDEALLGRFLVFAAGGVIPGRALPDPSDQKTAPLAFKVLQWLLNLEGATLESARDSLGFPFHLGGLDQVSSDLFVEAVLGASPDVLHLLVQFIAEQGFPASVPWARLNLTALASFTNWAEGASAVMAVEGMDPLVPITPSADTPLHWACKAGSFWATCDINGCSPEVDSETAALVAPGEVSPQHVGRLVLELAGYNDGAMANAVDCANRTPLFYAHSAAAIDALMDAGADVNARDSDGLDCVAFRISESMAEDNPGFEISIKDQIRLIVAHADYNHSAHFEMKSENADAGDGKESGAVWSHVEKYARDYCPQDPDLELIIRTTAKVKELFMLRLPEMPRARISNHVKTWMAFITKEEYSRQDLSKGDLLLTIETKPPNLRTRFLSAFKDYCKFPKAELDKWDSESAEYFMQKFHKAIDEDVIPLHGHHHTICFAGTLLEDVGQRFGRDALKTVLAFRKADWDDALEFMKPECKCDDPEHEHPPVTLYEFLKKRGVELKDLPDPKNEKPGCTVPMAQKKKHKLLPAPDAAFTEPEVPTTSSSQAKPKPMKRGFFGKAPEKSEAAKSNNQGKARPAWVEKCSNYGSDLLKGIEKAEMRKRLVACMAHKEAKANDENGASKRLFAFYDSEVDARCAPLDEVQRVPMPAKTKPSLKFAQWLKAEGNNLMVAGQKTKKPKTLGAPIPDGHKFQVLKCTLFDGAWTLYYLACCMLLDVMATGKESLGKAAVASAGDDFCKCLSNMAQACIDSARMAKDAPRGDKLTHTHAREQLMSAVSTATAALGCPNIENLAALATKSRNRVKEALSMLADDTQSDQVKQASRNIDTYVSEKEKQATPAS